MRPEQSTWKADAIESADNYKTRAIFGALMLAAAGAYGYGLGNSALGASEAYSVWAASKPGIISIIAIPVLHDPGKQVFYYILLHYFACLFGVSEIAVRMPSALFALGDLVLIFAVSRAMFDEETGLAAAAIWAFNPLAIVFASRARMYSMLVAMGLAHLWALWKLRDRPTMARTILCGVLGALLLYTHLGGALILGAEAAMLARDFIRGRRNPHVWFAFVITLVLFAPYLPIVRNQSQVLVSGHWLDWIGIPHHYSLIQKIGAGSAAAALGLGLILTPTVETGRDEPLRWLLAFAMLPTAALLAGSILVRPMFHIRYVAPAMAGVAILVPALLAHWSIKVRNLAAPGLMLAGLLAIPYENPKPEAWPRLAEMIDANGNTAQPIFFESGFISRGKASEVPNGGFPFGFYSVPFNYYFHGPNPRVVIPGYNSAAARAIIVDRVDATGGGWLVSWKHKEVLSELPDSHKFQIRLIAQTPELMIFRIVPVGDRAPQHPAPSAS
ncbi:MAG: glycosyltransferase family 39 protein [Candidatus Binataceae bacterium]|nr:glycosyltransferase family 39 protein [Candidatus Binataceae bacterium]